MSEKQYGYRGVCRRYSTNAGDKGPVLGIADANGAGFASSTRDIGADIMFGLLTREVWEFLKTPAFAEATAWQATNYPRLPGSYGGQAPDGRFVRIRG